MIQIDVKTYPPCPSRGSDLRIRMVIRIMRDHYVCAGQRDVDQMWIFS